MMSLPRRRCASVRPLMLAVLVLGCGPTVWGAPEGDGTAPASNEPRTDLVGGVDQSNPSGTTGGQQPQQGAGGTSTGAEPGDPGAGSQGNPAVVTGVELLVDALGAIHVPAVGNERVALLQYDSSGHARVLHVTWAREVGYWHESSQATHVYTAASGAHHPNLLATAEHGIYENGGATELSGVPTSYKEFSSASSLGFAWIDFGVPTAGSAGPGVAPVTVPTPPSGAGGATGSPPTMTVGSLGQVVFQTWAGARSDLTDTLRYRARIDLSETHIAYVEYASTTPGTPGQVMVQPLSGGAALPAAPGTLHQDRPAIDRDWVVWEEYLGATDTVIRGRNLSTGEVRDLSAAAGFRTNPDVRGARVVWEDQRGGDGDIYTADLGSTSGEHVAVSGAGYSTGARLTDDGLVWIEVNGNNMGILRARWVP